MGFVCPQTEWFQRDCKPLGGGGGGVVRPSSRLCCWMGLHFHGWIDYHGVASSLSLIYRFSQS